jgi:hypothetical protein
VLDVLPGMVLMGLGAGLAFNPVLLAAAMASTLAGAFVRTRTHDQAQGEVSSAVSI